MANGKDKRAKEEMILILDFRLRFYKDFLRIKKSIDILNGVQYFCIVQLK